MTSTPPAWKWRDECDVPVTNYTLADLLSIHSRKPPESDALRERNGSGTEPEASCFTTRKLDTFPTGEDIWPLERAVSTNAIDTCCADPCESTAQMADAQINAVPEHVESCASEGSREHRIGTCYLDPDTGETVMPADFFGEKELRWRSDKSDNLDDGEPICTATAPETTAPADSCVEKCPVCLHEMENDEGVLCDHCGEPTGPGSFAVVNGPGGVFVYHLPCYDEVYWGEETLDTLDPTLDTEADTFDVPFPVQSWTFEALIEAEVDHLHEIIDDHHDEIVKMARRRHRTGHVLHGSKGYQWDAKTRLRNVLEELADAPTYLTMGSIE